MNPIHQLPFWIICENINPYLDYESRINLNRILLPHQRYVDHFPDDYSDIFRCRCVTNLVKAQLNHYEMIKSLLGWVEQTEYVLHIMNSIAHPLNIVILKYHPIFFKTLVTKLAEFANKKKPNNISDQTFQQFIDRIHLAQQQIGNVTHMTHKCNGFDAKKYYATKLSPMTQNYRCDENDIGYWYIRYLFS